MALIGIGLLLQRRTFVVFGAIGVFIYLGDESWGYFRDSLGFTFSLVVLGLLLIAAGIVYKRKEDAWTRRLAPHMPNRLRSRQLRHS